MKNFNKIFFAAVAAAFGLASCSQELTPVEKPQDNLVTVNFGAEASIEPATKATLTTEDELTFKSAWENGDALSVEYISPETADNKIITATWNGTSFEAKGLPNETGAWDYTACYPKPDEKDNHIDFGANRTQKGNAYNSIYDVMIGNKSTKNSAAGKDDEGNDIVFNMDRKTAVAYFHLTGGPADEELVSAKLSVADGFIASQHAYISNFTFAPTEDLTEITITFPEKAPKASDFQLWFNVLPTKYTKMTLTVETANHTMTISRNTPEIDEYVAGNLYKVVKEIPAEKWVSKAAYTGGDLVFDFKTVQPKGWPTTSTTASEGTYKYAINGVDYSFIHGTGIYCAGTTPTSAYLMIAKSSSFGLPAIMGYRLVKVVGTLNDTGSPSTKAQISITNGTDVVSGGTAQTWNTKGADYTYTLTETEENTIYYLSVSSTANCQMIKLVLSYEPATPSVPKCATPEITIDKAGIVSIACATADATIHYTMGENPADPTEADAVFSAVTLTDGQTIKAIAVAEGFKPSAVASKKYTVGGIDYSKVYTSNVKTLDKIVKIGEVKYDATQVGTSKNAGSFSFNVPAGTTKLHLHVVGWKGEGGKTHSIKTSVGTISSTSITTVADTGANRNSPFTLSKTDYSGKDYYFEFTLTNITKESTITISNSAGNSRGVYFGINAE